VEVQTSQQVVVLCCKKQILLIYIYIVHLLDKYNEKESYMFGLKHFSPKYVNLYVSESCQLRNVNN
jgi:hypothetical protein